MRSRHNCLHHSPWQSRVSFYQKKCVMQISITVPAWGPTTQRGTGKGDHQPHTSQDIPGYSRNTKHGVCAFEAGQLKGKLLLYAQTQPIFKGMFFPSNPQKRL